MMHMTRKERIVIIMKRLTKEYPVPGPFIDWSNPLELLIGTILSAQCTDTRVNKVTKVLFKKYKTAGDYAGARLATLEKELYSTGFYRAKAKNIKATGKIIVEDFDGQVPDTLDALLTLKGASHKTSYIVLAKAFGKFEGVPVDTHVKRLSPRLGLTREKQNTDKISADLGKILPPKDFLKVNEYLITHGRVICVRVPKCDICVLNDICPTGKRSRS